MLQNVKEQSVIGPKFAERQEKPQARDTSGFQLDLYAYLLKISQRKHGIWMQRYLGIKAMASHVERVR